MAMPGSGYNPEDFKWNFNVDGEMCIFPTQDVRRILQLMVMADRQRQYFI